MNLIVDYFDKKLKEDTLDKLAFLECVKWLRYRSEHLSYSKDSSNAYLEAREIIQYLIKRYCEEFGFTSENYHDNEIGGLLFSTQTRLEDYTSYADTNKAKVEVIAVFKSDFEEDTRRLFGKIENE